MINFPFARVVLFLPLSIAAVAFAAPPRPSPYPVSWQLDFRHDLPKRIVVRVPGHDVPQAFWYLTYTVTNNTDNELTFFPHFELLTEDGQLTRSDKNIPLQVFQAIQKRSGNTLLEQAIQLAGRIRLGEDEARDGVAIWPEPMPEMGSFTIFVAGLSGETTSLQNSKGENVSLRKTLQLNFLVRGDEVYPGEDEVNHDAEAWIMR